MNLNPLSLFRRNTSAQRQTDSLGTVGLSSLVAAIMSGRSAPSYHRLKKAAKTNELFRSAINENIRPLITVPFLAEQWDETRQGWVRQQRHPLSLLLENPNPRYDKVKLWTRFLDDTFTLGNGLLLKRRSRATGKPVELWPLDSGRVVATAGDPVEGFYYFTDGTVFSTGISMSGISQDYLRKAVAEKRATRYDPEDIMHLYLVPDPDWPIWGEAPISPAMGAIDLDEAITAFLVQFFRRGTVASYIYSSKLPLAEGESDRMIKQWEQQMAGIDNFWNLAIIDGTEGTLTQVGTQLLKELGLHELRMDIEARILAPMNVPPVIVGAVIGLTNTQSYASYEQAREAFYEENAEPNITRLAAMMTHDLASEFEEAPSSLRVVADTGQVMALEAWRSERSKRLNQELAGSAITRNEHRVESGRLSVEGGDVVLQPTRSNPMPVSLKSGSDTEVPITRSRIRALSRLLSGDWQGCWEVIDKQIKASIPDGVNFDDVQRVVRQDIQEHPLRTEGPVSSDASRILLLVHMMTVAYGKGGKVEND